MKYWPRSTPAVIVALSLTLAALVSAPAALATGTNITGGTYGASCNSGGYFTPSSVSVATGDTVTISVPSNDSYSGGIQIHGFSEGNFTILPGSSHATAALSANVSYYGTWPSTGCMKGTGSITVTAATTPTPPPAAPPGPPQPTTPTSTTPPIS